MLKSTKIGRVYAGLLLGAVAAQAQTYTNAFPGLTFSRPLWMEEIPGKPDHYMVMEQPGSAQVVRKQGDTWVKEQFVKFTVSGGTSGGNEEGLLGFAFHPQYATNRKYYVYYVTNSGGYSNVIDERVADASLLKDAGTAAKLILRISDYADNHNGGTIRFGKDGFLYLGTGDGGSQGDPNGNGQNKNTLLAKMLRIDVNNPAGGKNYGIPSDNPYVGGGGAPEVYANGLRNPYKWAFDPVNGDLWVGDVGGSAAEEVNIIEKGGNYGWKISEGNSGVTGGIKGPVFAYGRGDGACIIGGYVYRGNPASKYYGQFIVSDYISRNTWAVTKNGQTTKLASPSSEPRGWGTDNAGRLYLMAGTSTVYRLAGADWDVATANFIPRDGALKQSIGCIFACRPGAKLDSKAFGDASSVEIFSLSGEKIGNLSRNAEVPALKLGMYIVKAPGSAKPNMMMIK